MNTLASVISDHHVFGNAWDLISFLTNSKNYAKTVGGLFLSLLGLIGVIWGAVQGIKKLMSDQPGQQSGHWGKIIALIIAGGALLASGIAIVIKVSSGGSKTITDLGDGGAINFGHLFSTQGSVSLIGMGVLVIALAIAAVFLRRSHAGARRDTVQDVA